MRRIDREMPKEFALGVADTCPYAVLSTVTPEGRPYCVPVTIVRDGESIYFHSAKEGRKVECFRHSPEVSIACVQNVLPMTDRFSTFYESAIVCGGIEEVADDAEKIRALRLLCTRYTPAHMPAFDKTVAESLAHTAIWRVRIEDITGKKH